MSIVSQILANPERYSVQQLQQAMESGAIPGYVAIPLIQDKVQEQQRMQMMMQGQGAPQEGGPTVAEEVMQEADQSQGIPALASNLPQDEYSYAPGGIVAFEHGGEVPRYRVGGLRLPDDYSEFGADALLGPDYEQTQESIASLAPYASLEEEQKQPSSGLVDAIRRNMAVIQELRGAAPSSKEDVAALRTLLSQRASQSAEDAKTAKERNVIGLLANIAASRDPYSSVAIGSGVAKSLPEFAAAEEAQRKQQMENAMANLSLTKAEREEALAGLPGAIQLTGYESDLEAKKATAAARERIARIAASKPHQNEMSQWMDAYVAGEQEKISAGQRKPASEAILRQEAGQALINARQAAAVGATAQRSEAAQGQLGLGYGELGARISAIEESARNRATDAVTASLNNPRSPESREMKRIYREQGADAAANYKLGLIDNYIKGVASAPTTAAKAVNTTKAAGSSTLSAVDQKALEWANANPQDPRAAQIKARLGIR